MFTSPPSHWEQLPPELKLHILQLIRPQFITGFTETSHAGHLISQNNFLWQKYYLNEFGFMDFPDQARKQYIAATLYRQAENCSRLDQAQLLFQDAYRYLQTCKDEPWADYYFGVMYFYGKGVRKDKDKGWQLLNQSFLKKDHRAAIEIANIIISNEDEIKSDITSQDLLPILIKAHEKGSPFAARIIGYLHSDGLFALAVNRSEAKVWFEKALQIDFDAYVEDMIELLKIEDTSKSMQNITAFLEKQCPAPIIDYHLGYIQKNLKNEQEAFSRFLSASEAGFIPAYIELAKLYLKKTQTGNKAEKEKYISLLIETLKKAAQKGNLEAIDALLIISAECLSEAITLLEFFEEEFIKGNSIAAIFLGRYCLPQSLKKESLNELLNQPIKIFWLQLAAQYRDSQSLKALLDLHVMHNEYASLALGIIYKFGVIGSSSIQPNSEEAEKFFAHASSDTIKNYLAIDADNHFFLPHIRKELVERQNKNLHLSLTSS